MRSTIIGCGHYSRVGKDSFANQLVKELRLLGTPARKRSFSWKLKDICHQLYAWDGLREAEFYDTPEGEALRDVPLPTIGKTPVELWIAMGTPAVRDNVYDRTWIQYLTQNLEPGVTVVPDVRFPNEAEALRDWGGTLVKIIRPGVAPRLTSVADRALLGFTEWDLVLGQSGRLDDLRLAASWIAREIAAGRPVPRQTLGERQRALRIESKTLRDAGIDV